MDARAYIEQFILDPAAYVVPGFDDLMPKTWGRVLNSEELDALIAFLFTLNNERSAEHPSRKKLYPIPERYATIHRQLLQNKNLF